MKTKILFIAYMALLMVSCRERTNIFDIGNDNFTTPPHSDAWVDGYYIDPNGYLVGVRIQIEFTDPFERTLPLYFEFYQDISRVLDFEEEFAAQTTVCYENIFGPYEVGWYSLRYSFGGIPLGAALFEVVESDGILRVKGAEPTVVQLTDPLQWHQGAP